MDRRRACLPIPAGLPHHPQISRGQTLGRSAIPDCPGGSTGTSHPFASLRAKGRSASGRVPPMDDLDNPGRRGAGRPSDNTSANSYGFAVASTAIHRRMDTSLCGLPTVELLQTAGDFSKLKLLNFGKLRMQVPHIGLARWTLKGPFWTDRQGVDFSKLSGFQVAD